MNMQVEIKSIYGNDTIYPFCETAKAFAKLLKQKTFTMHDIQCIKILGYTIEVVSQRNTL